MIEELCDAYDMARPDPILRFGEHDAHAAAGVLKQYLRELPEPVIPYRQYDRLKATGYLIEDGQDLKPIIDQLECLPAPNYSLLQFLCQLLSEVSPLCSIICMHPLSSSKKLFFKPLCLGILYIFCFMRL